MQKSRIISLQAKQSVASLTSVVVTKSWNIFAAKADRIVTICNVGLRSKAESAATFKFELKKKPYTKPSAVMFKKCFFPPLHSISFAIQQPHGRKLIQPLLKMAGTPDQPRTMYRSETGSQAVTLLLSSHVGTICVFFFLKSLPRFHTSQVTFCRTRLKKKCERKFHLQPYFTTKRVRLVASYL